LLPLSFNVRKGSHTSKEKKEVISPTLTIKVVGHQWFWSYELSDFITDNGTAIDFDSCVMFWENINMGNILSNSGDSLKLLIPNYIRKSISGWTNHSDKVTSQKRSENEMGNRGSKSVNYAVKEQRVDGSWYIKSKPLYLRCTLMAFERKYPINNPSKQLNISQFSTLINKENLSNGTSNLYPWFITGFTLQQENSISKKTSIVVWGTNLTSNVGYPKYTKIISNNIELSYNIKSFIYGILLSDGWITYGSKTSKNARLGFKQSFTHFEYLWHVFNLLSHYSSSYPHTTIGKRNNTIVYGLEFFTRSLPCFSQIHSLWYYQGTKVLPYDLFDYLTPIALANWIMGDGTRNRYGLILCTDSYSLKDIILLINILIIKYDLKCNLREPRKNQFRIYIQEKSMNKLRLLVKPHMIESMLYKIN
jgi:LAGLIDADG DNA endonuclease family/Cytochrome C oxidase subunit II, periplasmic domain